MLTSATARLIQSDASHRESIDPAEPPGEGNLLNIEGTEGLGFRVYEIVHLLSAYLLQVAIGPPL